MKCTGLHCPMQHGYDVENCKLTDCKYRTKPKTNFERIKAMSIEEMAEWICGIYDENETPYCADKYISGYTIPDYCETEIQKWLESEI